MKKIIALLLALVMMCALLVGCSGDSTDETDAAETTEATGATDASETANENVAMTIEEIKAQLTTVEEGKLTVATSPDFAPYEFYTVDEDGNYSLAGFDMDLAQYIADYLGLELEVIPMDFDGTLAELANKNVDLSMAGYSPDPDRLDKMDFSDIYYTGGQSFVCVQDNKDSYPTLEEANSADFQIGAQVGSIQVDLAKQYTPDADIVELTKVTDIIAELLSGKLDGAFIETAVAQTYALNYPELCVLHQVPYDQEGSVIGVYKGNEALLAGVNMAIAEAVDSGAMDQFVAEANEAASGNTYEGLLSE